MLECKTRTDSEIVELVVDGQISREDYDKVSEKITAALAKHGKIRVLKEVRNFSGLDFNIFGGSLLGDIMKNFSNVKSVAVVSDEAWVDTLTNFAKPCYPYPIKSFKLSQIKEAREWLKTAG